MWDFKKALFLTVTYFRQKFETQALTMVSKFPGQVPFLIRIHPGPENLEPLAQFLLSSMFLVSKKSFTYSLYFLKVTYSLRETRAQDEIFEFSRKI